MFDSGVAGSYISDRGTAGPFILDPDKTGIRP